MMSVQPSPSQLRASAELHASRREWAKAIDCFQQLLEQRPGDADVLLQLSYLHSLAGHYRLARRYALLANEARPSKPEIVKELIARLRTFNEVGALNECIARLPALSNVSIPLLLNFAAQLSYLNQQERALVFLDEAYRGDPDYPATLLARAQVLTYLGRFTQAEADLHRCMRRAPALPKLYWLLARLKTWSASENHVPQIQRLLASPAVVGDDRAMLAYALHKELDDLGQVDAAWQALTEACAAKRSTLTYSSEQTRALVNALCAMPVEGSAEQPAGLKWTPIFIVGMHRSGTTLLEQILDGHTRIHGVGEVYDFTCAMREATDYHCRGVMDLSLVERSHGVEFPEVGRRYVAGMAWRLDSTGGYFTDKLPSNFLNIGFICKALPHAKILHMVRDPVETCFSNLRELFSDANPYSYSLPELADYHREYQRLMRHWHQAYPGRILDVSYAALTADPEGCMREVTGFCGIGFESSMLATRSRSRAVATASAVQVRGDIAARDVPKWQPYAKYLAPLLERLGA